MSPKDKVRAFISKKLYYQIKDYQKRRQKQINKYNNKRNQFKYSFEQASLDFAKRYEKLEIENDIFNF